MDNDMMERKVDCDCISQTEAKKEYVVVVAAAAAAAVGEDRVADLGVAGETDVVGLGGNCGIGVRLVRYMMGLHYGDGFLWMVIVEIVEVGVNLCEGVEERGKNMDSLDVDQD